MTRAASSRPVRPAAPEPLSLPALLGACLPTGFSRLLTRGRVLLPYYHLVSDEWVPHVSPLYRFRGVREFTDDVDFFLRHFRPIGLKDLLSAAAAGRPPPPNSFLLTFDDGFREMFDIACPILRAKGVPAVFFVTSSTVDNQALCVHQKVSLLLDWLDRNPSPSAAREIRSRLSASGLPAADAATALKSITHARRGLADDIARICGVDFSAYLREVRPHLTSEQIAGMLRDGFSVGGHSIDHPLYGDIPLEEQLRQTRESMRFLRERFALDHRVFAFPHTDFRVSRNFFEALSREGTVEATFGTSAPSEDSVPNNFQRFTMEKTIFPARAVLGRQALRRLKQQATGRATIQRPTLA
jgi:peptidoglycan/xylan/chitin deacetylase (PgdA/CDA1 family)